jgi:single-strand DNA-binding protein
MEGTTYPRMNRVFLTGTAQEEPELRYTPSGVTVCSFRVQVGRILRDRTGGSREVAAYLTIVAWQEAAQRMSRELKKGQAVYVEGYVSSRSFTTARGEKRTAVEIYAEQIQILGPFVEGERPAEGAREEGRSGGGRGGRRGPAEAKHDETAPETPAVEAHGAEAPPAEHHEEVPPHHEEGSSEDTLAL